MFCKGNELARGYTYSYYIFIIIDSASKTALLRQRTQFAKTFAYAGKVNAARVLWCALKGRAAEENSDCTEQSEDNGVVLKITTFCFVSSKQKV